MRRDARFSGKWTGPVARSVAVGLLLAGSVYLAARASEPDERRVAWRGVSLVLPGGFAPAGTAEGQRQPFAVFRDRLRAERELRVFRLKARPGSTGEADMDEPEAETGLDPDAGHPPTAYPSPEALLRIMFPALLGGLTLPPDADIDGGVKKRADGVDVPFAAWAGVTGGAPNAANAGGVRARTIVGVMVTTDGRGSYAVLALRDPTYPREELEDRVAATGELLRRTLETVIFREPAAEKSGRGDA